MRGDFSSFWNKEDKRNFNGVLHQQGRVLLDRDWNAQTEIVSDWQDTAAADIIGAGVAAVPADAGDSFKVTRAEIKTAPDRVEVSVNKGRVWADGLLIEAAGDAVRAATYLRPPVQTPAGSVGDLPNNVRDAVILEAWHEELNAFQMPDLLIEPALGGVDTTERFQTAYRYRLYRMDADDTCDSIINALRDDFSAKGKLRAVLQPDEAIDGDCPVVEGGGYTGFEHQLYRIEIAQTRHSESYFKWSQTGGGLVGRGTFDSPNRKLKIDANLNAILHSDLTGFYLETVEEANGYQQVTFGAKVTLNTADNTLTLPANAADVFFNTVAAMDGKRVFFRLWNDIRRIADFTAEAPLQDGIRLQFEADAAGKYTPHDYWTFSVRTEDVFNLSPFLTNSATLVANQPPQGIFYHRVPLAELNWTGNVIDDQGEDIEDCRRIFQPLTKLKGCCTYRVGDGVNSHGDFTEIQKAIDHLPRAGGQICVLPGEYRENIRISSPRNRNISIKGCGNRTRVIAADDAPVFHVAGGINLKIESLSIMAHDEGVGILLEGDEIAANTDDRTGEFGVLRNIKLENLRVVAAERSAIEMHVGQFVSICRCQIFIRDEDTEWAAIYLAGDDLLFEENEIRVMTGRAENISFEKTDDPSVFPPARRATGGLHLSGGCERVRVINNIIIGGIGNGINLGSVDREIDREIIVIHEPWHRGSKHDDGDCDPNPGYIDTTIIDERTRLIAGAPLRDILIERNRIYSMGRNGIGVDAFFVVEEENNPNDRYLRRRVEFISVENLVVIGNRIEHCLNRPAVDIKDAMTNFMGYGGIALSEVGNLVVRDNFIRNNGADSLNATCGIFILHGRGLEISRNHVLDNGRVIEVSATGATVKNGARGGIFIRLAGNGALPLEKTAAPNRGLTVSAIRPNGVPALKMHENIVAVPMGRALTMQSVGDVMITDNQFSSHSLVPGFSLESLTAASVLIISFNTSKNYRAQPQGYAKYRSGQVKTQPMQRKSAGTVGTPAQPATGGATVNAGANAGDNFAAAELSRIFLGGAIHFADNQCQLFGRSVERQFAALTSILILSLADISFLGNRTDCSLSNSILLTDTLLFGVNVRASDNSWQETPQSVFFSAVTFGIFNTTTDNHSTHCLLVVGLLFLNKYNLTLIDLAFGLTGDITRTEGTDERSPCARLTAALFGNFGKKQTSENQFATDPGFQDNVG